MIRDLMSNMGFTLSMFSAVAAVFFYAAFLDAPEELVATMLWLGVLTAIAEYIMRKQVDGRR